MEICLKTFTTLYGIGAILIFGCAAEKDVLSMVELCLPNFSIIIITTPGTFKKSFPEEIYATFIKQKQRTKNEPEILFIPDTAEAVDHAVDLALKKELPILGAGSFYLAAEIRERIRRN
jgi:dihydrofolate synthase/folylpolyglutamate synthase